MARVYAVADFARRAFRLLTRWKPVAGKNGVVDETAAAGLLSCCRVKGSNRSFQNAVLRRRWRPMEQSLQPRAQGGDAVWNRLGLRETSRSVTSTL